MTTRYEDAISVLGEEYKSDIEELEKEFQKNPQLKSEVEELITKSIAEVDQEEVVEKAVDKFINEDGSQIITNAEFQPMKDFLSKLTAEGKITQDVTTNILNEMLRWISSYYEDKAMIEKAQKIDMEKDKLCPECDKEDGVCKDCAKKKMDMKSDVEDAMEYKPLGGATSLGDAQTYIDTQKLTYNVYQAYSLFGAVCSNILNTDEAEMPIQDKLTAMQNLLKEFIKILTPEKLMEMSMAEKQTEVTKNDNKEVVEQSTVNSLDKRIDEIVEKLDTYMNQLPARDETNKNPVVETKSDIHPLVDLFDKQLKSAIDKPNEERKQEFQSILDTIGQRLLELDKEMTPVTEVAKGNPEPEIKSIVENVMADKMQIVNEQMGLMQAQLGKLAEMLNKSIEKSNVPAQINQPVKLQAPQLKARVNLNPPPVPQNVQLPQVKRSNPNGMSIADIVRKTVY